MSDSDQYRQKKAFFDRLLTIYGRKPVLEALQDPSLSLYKLHLADSNKPGGIIGDIIQVAERRGITIEWHDRKALSRISKNGKQDQGVAADIELRSHQPLDEFLQNRGDRPFRLVALDGITNPQNLGMAIRSIGASPVDGLILPRKGCAPLSPLVIKASAGTLFKTPLLQCDALSDAMTLLKTRATLCTLSSAASESLFDYRPPGSVVYILGNETDGVSDAVEARADIALSIPMCNGVESLNVAVTAALVAFNATEH